MYSPRLKYVSAPVEFAQHSFFFKHLMIISILLCIMSETVVCEWVAQTGWNYHTLSDVSKLRPATNKWVPVLGGGDLLRLGGGDLHNQIEDSDLNFKRQIVVWDLPANLNAIWLAELSKGSFHMKAFEGEYVCKTMTVFRNLARGTLAQDSYEQLDSAWDCLHG